jgi:hypothetical protein
VKRITLYVRSTCHIVLSFKSTRLQERAGGFQCFRVAKKYYEINKFIQALTFGCLLCFKQLRQSIATVAKFKITILICQYFNEYGQFP